MVHAAQVRSYIVWIDWPGNSLSNEPRSPKFEIAAQGAPHSAGRLRFRSAMVAGCITFFTTYSPI
jgi:hypothetical protein